MRRTVVLMCGRYASTRSATDLAELFGALDESDGELVADFNVAPTDPAPIIRCTARVSVAVLSVARWGFVPAWASDPAGPARMINARAETVATSSVFAEAWRRRRALVPADGWYEWRREAAGRRRPVYLTRPGGFAFGGIWSAPARVSDTQRPTFSIITVPARGELAAVHDRMPLMIAQPLWLDWLRGNDPAALLTLSTSSPSNDIEVRPVSDAVGDVRKDGPELVAPRSTVDDVLTLF